MCLKHSQDVINPEPPCTYGTALTEIFRADANSISASAPITVTFHFKWPVGAENYAGASLNTLNHVKLYLIFTQQTITK